VKIVFNVGQCGFDHRQISALCNELGASATAIHSEAELHSHLKKEIPELILINRILDRDGSSGLDIIKRLKSGKDTKALPVMLISNYPSAQAEAMACGALEGFGKDSLGSKGREVLNSLINSPK
jgi:hypothetical protein